MSIGKSKIEKERKKINDDMVLMWLNWSIAIIIAMHQLLNIYRFVSSMLGLPLIFKSNIITIVGLCEGFYFYFSGKLQIILLKFGVDWILYSKVSKTLFYTLKFSFISNSPLRLISVVKWQIIILICFIFAKLASKLRCFSDDQVKNWHASKLRHFKPKLKIKTSP